MQEWLFFKTCNTDKEKALDVETLLRLPKRRIIGGFPFYASIRITYCQKLKHCSTFLIYNDVHYHISSVVLFQKRKGKQTEMTDAPSGDRSRERDYITREREEEEDRRERTSYIDYLYVTSLLCNPVLRRTGRRH